MAAHVSLNAVVLLNGVDLSCYLKQVKVEGNGDVLDATTLCSTGAKSWAVGLIDRVISGSGFYKHSSTVTKDDIDGLFNTALNDPSGNYLISVAEEGGGSAGSPAILGNAKMAKYDIDSTIGQLLMIAFEAKATKTSTAASLRPGYWLFKATSAGATTGTAVDSIASHAGYIANFHNYDGDGSVSIQLQSSTNNSTWVNLGSAVVVPINTASEVLNVVNTANRYLRAIVTPAGTTNSVGVTISPSYSG